MPQETAQACDTCIMEFHLTQQVKAIADSLHQVKIKVIITDIVEHYTE